MWEKWAIAERVCPILSPQSDNCELGNKFEGDMTGLPTIHRHSLGGQPQVRKRRMRLVLYNVLVQSGKRKQLQEESGLYHLFRVIIQDQKTNLMWI